MDAALLQQIPHAQALQIGARDDVETIVQVSHMLCSRMQGIKDCPYS